MIDRKGKSIRQKTYILLESFFKFIQRKNKRVNEDSNTLKQKGI